jgi:hypothetical protein
MSVRSTISLFVALFTIALLAGCGSSSPTAVAPPSGGFSNSDLNGTYVFSVTGSDANGAFLTLVGSAAANGSGGITSGTVDFLDSEVIPTSPIAQAITGGSYSITADGRGQIHFNTTINNSNDQPTSVTFTLDLVLTSSSHGLVTEYDGNGTGSGTIDLQSSVAQSQIAGSYAFGVSGAGNGGLPLALVGAMTLGGTGTVTTGIEDINDDGIAQTGVGGVALSTSSFVTVGTPGTALIATSGSGSFSFDVYPIDSTHLKFVENDGFNLLSGDVYTQGASIPSGQLVYTMAGSENNSGNGTEPIDVGGWLTNNGGTITTGEEDYNDGGNVGLNLGISGGSFAALAGGRSTLTLDNFVNGAANDLPGAYTFAAYPFSYSGGTGIQLLEIDNAGVTSGTAYPQTGVTLAASPEGYGFNLTGFNSGGEEDDIAEFVTSSTGFSGIVDLNDLTSLSFDKALSTSAFSAPDGNGVGSVTTNYWMFNFYVVNPTTNLVLETDSGQVGLGTFQEQTTPVAGTAQGVVSLFRPVARPHTTLKKRK